MPDDMSDHDPRDFERDAECYLERELARRPKRTGDAEVVILDDPTDCRWPVVTGSLAILWTTDAGRLSDVASSLAGGLSTAQLIDADAAPGPLPSGDTDPLDAIEVLFWITYSRKRIAGPFITLPGNGQAVQGDAIGWVGGPLDSAAFGVEAHPLPGDREVSVLLVANPPAVSATERALLMQLPEELSQGSFEPQAPPAAAVVAGVLATALAGHYVDKATDWIDKKVVDAVRDQNRYVPARPAHIPTRHQYRNAVSLPQEDPVDPADAVRELDWPATIEDLLEVRRAELERRRPK